MLNSKACHDECWLVDDVASEPVWQGHGIGLALVRRCGQSLLQSGLRGYQLYTNIVITEPLGCYRSFGFQEINWLIENGQMRVYFAKYIG